jgi:hypothetical protein
MKHLAPPEASQVLRFDVNFKAKYGPCKLAVCESWEGAILD